MPGKFLAAKTGENQRHALCTSVSWLRPLTRERLRHDGFDMHHLVPIQRSAILKWFEMSRNLLEHLVETESQPEFTLELDGEISEDKEAAIYRKPSASDLGTRAQLIEDSPLLSMSFSRCKDDTSVPARAA
jgi:hypothetical protein